MICLGHVQAQSPTKKQYLESAEKHYADKNFYWALVNYNTVLEFDEKDPVVIFKAAESARQFNAYARAAEKYKYLIDTLNDDTQPLSIYWLASMNQRMGKYDEAKKYFDMYLSEYSGTDSLYTELAQKELVSLEYAKGVTTNPKKNVTIDRLGEDVNSPSSDVSAIIHKKKLYFSSMKYYEENAAKPPKREISKLLVKNGEEEEAELIPGYVNERDSLVSNVAISTDGTTIYYTICHYINSSDIECDIYKSDLDSLGNLSNEMKLPDPINLEGTTSTHPHLAIDKVTGKEFLYFVSYYT